MRGLAALLSPRATRAVAGGLGGSLVILWFGLATSLSGSAESDALRSRAFEQAYNLDHDEAIATLRQAVAIDPENPATHRSIAAVTWLNILFRRGAVTVDHYLGGLSRADVKLEPPPPDLQEMFRSNVERALRLAEQQVARNPKDPRAQYELGAAVGLLASYSATVEGKVFAGFRAARRAYNAHEYVLELDPQRKDAALIVGTYRYIVAALALPVRMMAYVVGFGGGKERGLRMVREAADFRSDVQTEARFALILLYNRERRYAEALEVIAGLQRAYPRNRLLWLEAGSTALRAGRAKEAEASLEQGMTMLERDRRPKAFGEQALWRLKRGSARVALKHPDAEADLRAAMQLDARDWVRGRAAVELGKLADLAGDRARARGEYDRAIRLCGSDSDPGCVREAERLRASGYTQTPQR